MKFSFKLAILLLLFAASSRADNFEYQTNISSGTTQSLNAVVYGTNNFAAVGNNSVALASIVPLTNVWQTSKVTSASVNLTAIGYGNGTFLAGDNLGNVYTSSNGTNWSIQGYVLQHPVPAGGIAFNGNTFVAVEDYPFIVYANKNNLGPSGWTNSTINNLNGPLTSFSAVTPFTNGFNGFLACGYSGDGVGGAIWLSKDLGVTWNGVYGGANSLFLRGIVSAGTNTVAVGTGGTILLATGGGGTTNFTLQNSPTANNLNAVTWTGSEFIAVGNGGVIVSSTNGINWSLQISPTTQNLLGVAYANGGGITNQAVIVGTNGTVIIGSVPPTSSLAGSTTMLTGGSTTITATLGGSPGPWSVTWDTNGLPLITNSPVGYSPGFQAPNLLVTPTDPYPNTYTNTTFTVGNLSDLVSGFTNTITGLTGNALITVDPIPTVTLIGSTTITNGASTILTATNTGFGPFAETWNDKESFTTNIGNGPWIYTRLASPVNTNLNEIVFTNYTITALTETNGYTPTNLSSTVKIVVDPVPTVAIGGSTNIPNGVFPTIVVTNTGFGPFTNAWNDKAVYTNVSIGDGPWIYTRTAYTTNTGTNSFIVTTYAITNSVETNSYSVLSYGGSVTITNYPLPVLSFSIVGSSVVDNGGLVTIGVTNTGFGPFTNIWNDGAVYTNVNLGSGPWSYTRQLNLTNLFGDHPTNYSFAITSASEIYGYLPASYPAPVTFAVAPTVSGLLSGATTITNGGTATLTANISGFGPFTNEWNDQTVFTTNLSDGPWIYTRPASPVNTNLNLLVFTNYYLTVLSETNGYTNAYLGGVIPLVVDPVPTVAIGGSTNIPNGIFPTIVVTNTGFGPFTNAWNDGAVYTNTIIGDGPWPYTRPAYTTNTSANLFLVTTYTITNSVETNGYSVLSYGGSVTITNYPMPVLSFSIVGSSVVDNGGLVTIGVTNTGFGPFTNTWNDGAVYTNVNLGSGPWSYTRQINLTNLFGDHPTNYSFAITSASEIYGYVPASYPAPVTFAVAPTVSALLSGATTIVNGGVATLTADVSGFGPFTNVWNDQAGFTTNLSDGPWVYTRPASPANTNLNSLVFTNYYLTLLSETNGYTNADLGGVIPLVVDPTPTVTISGSTNIANGTVAGILVTNTGFGPFTNTWNDGPVYTNINLGSGPWIYTRPVYTTNYSTNAVLLTTNNLTTVTETNGYSVSSFGGIVVITNYPLPTVAVTVIGSTIISNLGLATIAVTNTGVGPFTNIWHNGSYTNIGPAGNGPWGYVRTIQLTNTTGGLLTNKFSISSATEIYGYAATNVSAAYAQFVVAPPASVTVSPSPANGIVCNGDSYGILVTNYGVGPFTNIWNDGAVSNSVNSGVYTRTFTAPNNTNINTAIYVTNYIETATAYNGFPATNTGSHLVFTIEPTIKATVSILNAIGNVTNIYSGQTITNQVVLTGYGPLNVQWSGQSNSVPTASGDGPFTNYYAVTLTNSSLSLPATNYIALVGLSSAGDCPVPSNGVTNSVVVWPAPVLQIAPVYYTNIFTNKKSQTITNLAFTNLVLTWFAPAPINLQSATNLVTPGGANSWVYVTNSTLAVTNTAKIGATNATSFFRLSTAP